MDIEKYKESMPRCKDCTGFGWGECKTAGENEVACKDFERKPKLTNGDRIRQMTDEELADWITDGHDLCDLCQFSTCRAEFECEKGVLEWLKQEVREDATERTD